MLKLIKRMRYFLDSTLSILILCVLIVLIIYTYTSNILTKNVEESLTQIAKQGAKTIEQDLRRQLEVIKTISKLDIIRDSKVPIEEKMEFLNSYIKSEDLLRISIADRFGKSLTTDNGDIYVGDRKYFKDALEGEDTVSDPIVSRVDGRMVVVFAVPVYENGRVDKVIYATYRAEDLSIMTNDITLGNGGCSFIIDGTGVIIAHKDKSLINKMYSQSNREKFDDKLYEIEKKMVSGAEGAGTYKLNGIEKYIGYAPIKGTHWSVGVTVPKSEIFRSTYRLIVILLLSLVLLSFSIIIMNLYNKYLQKNLQKEKVVLDSAIKAANLVIIRFDQNGTITDFNKYAEEKLGFNKEEVVKKMEIHRLLTEEGKNTLNTVLDNLKKKVETEYFEMSLKTSKGDTVYVLWNYCDTHMGKNEIEIMGIDITHRVLAEEELKASHDEIVSTYEQLMASQEELKAKYDELKASRKKLEESEERYRLVIEASNIGIWDFDMINNVRFYSNKWFYNLGLIPGEYDNLDELWGELMDPKDRESLIREVNNHLRNQTEQYEYVYKIRRKDGQTRWIKAVGQTLWDADGKPVRRAGSDIDITELKDYENRLHNLAYYDTLTGLPNRAMLIEKLEALTYEDSEKKFALFFIDTDNFKLVNDTLGHAIGDQLIIQVGNRLRCLVGENMVFRLGGDEFIIIISDFDDIDEIKAFAEKLLGSFDKSFEINDSILNATASAGISIYPMNGKTPNELLKNADIAMYKAKELGKSRYVMFNQTMNNEIAERTTIEKYLRKALDNNEFILYYQPQISISTGRISGFEALVRWNSPEMGLVPPLKFIKTAEDSRLIIPLGSFVLRSACAFIKKVHEIGYSDCTIAVNISIPQLMQEDFEDMVLNAVETAGIDPKNLELEITESILMESFDLINKKLDALRQKGVKVALDDFGKGYSSLNYLEKLSISTLKIDKSFIDSIMEESNREPLIGAIVLIGHQMGLNVLAEGVETERQLEYLKLNKCDIFQGYLYSKPIPEQEALGLVNGNTAQCPGIY